MDYRRPADHWPEGLLLVRVSSGALAVAGFRAGGCQENEWRRSDNGGAAHTSDEAVTASALELQLLAQHKTKPASSSTQHQHHPLTPTQQLIDYPPLIIFFSPPSLQYVFRTTGLCSGPTQGVYRLCKTGTLHSAVPFHTLTS